MQQVERNVKTLLPPLRLEAYFKVGADMKGQDQKTGALSARERAARNAAQSIVVGILKDACDVMLEADCFQGKGVDQARRVSKWCQAVLDELPQLTSVRGLKNLEEVCNVFSAQHAAIWPDLPSDSGMSAITRIFAAHAALDELRRRFGLRSRAWRYLIQTTTTLVSMLLVDVPEEEERMWTATVPVVDKIMEVAA